MDRQMDRRDMLKLTTAATAGLALSSPGLSQVAATTDRLIRVGVIGLGNRGTHLTRILCQLPNVQVTAVCDIKKDHVARAQKQAEPLQQLKPQGYSDGPEAYKTLCDREDLDAVIVATPWELHTPMSVFAMKAGKYAASEVPCAITMKQCWELVETYEQTGVPFMMLENWSFRRDNLAVLNMIRKGLMGKMVHCHCAHSHDCIDHWFFDPDGRDRWPAKYLIERNCDQYPTHSVGPVLSWMDINCGDAFASITSTATASRGINAYFARKFGPDHPSAKRKYAQGDIVTSVIKTHQGKTIVVNYDMQLPRPYDNRWMIQGTLGVYREAGPVIYVTGQSPEYHQWEPFGPYQTKFDHSWWKALDANTEKFGHGGTDLLEIQQFIKAVREKKQTPIDVYDSVTMSAITPLSEMSIARNSQPVECPDFTRNRWKTRKPTFAIDV